MSSHEVTEVSIQEKYESIKPYLNERTRRIWAATEALALGRGGISQVARATGLSRTTIYEGIAELDQRELEPQREPDVAQIRSAGGGRKRLVNQDKTLLEDLLSLVEASTRGDPESPLLWTCKSTPKLAAELQAQGHQVSQQTVWRLLEELDYSLQSHRKVHEGADEADRDEQFLYRTHLVSF